MEEEDCECVVNTLPVEVRSIHHFLHLAYALMFANGKNLNGFWLKKIKEWKETKKEGKGIKKPLLVVWGFVNEVFSDQKKVRQKFVWVTLFNFCLNQNVEKWILTILIYRFWYFQRFKIKILSFVIFSFVCFWNIILSE